MRRASQFVNGHVCFYAAPTLLIAAWMVPEGVIYAFSVRSYALHSYSNRKIDREYIGVARGV